MTPLEEIAHLGDVPVKLEIELDRKLTPLEEILDWEVGGVIWLTRSAGENLDVFVGGTLFGSGEIVMMESTFGIRLTDFDWPAS
ncbi:MAG: FliM/FliN family flagellar motor switch protein [Bryobacteraceae bacterium]|jgi:flagellar motor switch protein FliN/FliY